jgi:hypothetical protein
LRSSRSSCSATRVETFSSVSGLAARTTSPGSRSSRTPEVEQALEHVVDRHVRVRRDEHGAALGEGGLDRLGDDLRLARAGRAPDERRALAGQGGECCALAVVERARRPFPACGAELRAVAPERLHERAAVGALERLAQVLREPDAQPVDREDAHPPDARERRFRLRRDLEGEVEAVEAREHHEVPVVRLPGAELRVDDVVLEVVPAPPLRPRDLDPLAEAREPDRFGRHRRSLPAGAHVRGEARLDGGHAVALDVAPEHRRTMVAQRAAAVGGRCEVVTDARAPDQAARRVRSATRPSSSST